MQKLMIEMDYEMADKIVVQALEDAMNWLVYEKDQAKFSWDEKEEKKQILKLRKAFKRVLSHYGKEVDL
jgi:glycine cleavage system pyridoxal-binding protein P